MPKTAERPTVALHMNVLHLQPEHGQSQTSSWFCCLLFTVTAFNIIEGKAAMQWHCSCTALMYWEAMPFKDAAGSPAWHNILGTMLGNI